jgi:hypothetical protein
MQYLVAGIPATEVVVDVAVSGIEFLLIPLVIMVIGADHIDTLSTSLRS